MEENNKILIYTDGSVMGDPFRVDIVVLLSVGAEHPRLPRGEVFCV